MAFWEFKLGVSKQGIKDTEVGMAKSRRREGKVEEIPDHDVDQNAEVVSVKILVGLWGGEEEVK